MKPSTSTLHDVQADATYDELRASLPESDRPKFDEIAAAGCGIDVLAEEVSRYLAMRRFWADVPDEAKDGLDRILAAGEQLEGLPDEEAARLAQYLIVKRAGDFTPVRHQRFMWQVQLARKPIAAPIVHTQTLAAPRERREHRTADKTRGSPDDDPEPSEPWALSFVDRAPALWRLRAARCRHLEVREGVES